MFVTKINIIIVILLSGAFYSKTHAQITSWSAGFKVVRIVDTSRIYKPDTDTNNYLHYRPIDIDIWYPAQTNKTDTVLSFKHFLDLFESRANYYTASNAGDGLAGNLAQSFCEGFKCSTPNRLLNYKTDSYKNAEPASENFPVMIYMASYNGMGYENFKLFEDLAKKGFVTISISSIGRYPGDMTMKKEDMMEQVYDAVSSLKYLKRSPHLDFNRIGILGYSWGGLSAAILSTMIPDVSCLISMDGSEFHHYKNKDEDADFDRIKDSPPFKASVISVPYLRLESSPLIKNKEQDSVYNFTEKLSNSHLVLKIDSTEHQDFCCLPLIVKLSGNCSNSTFYFTISKSVTNFLEDHLKDKDAVSQTSVISKTELSKSTK